MIYNNTKCNKTSVCVSYWQTDPSMIHPSHHMISHQELCNTNTKAMGKN